MNEKCQKSEASGFSSHLLTFPTVDFVVVVIILISQVLKILDKS